MVARSIAHRVDALSIAWKTRLNGDAMDAIAKCADDAIAGGKHAVRIGGYDWSMSTGRSEGRVTLERGPVRGVFDSSGPDGWTLELVARSTYLAANPLHQVIDDLGNMAAELGESEAIRLRRFDMAADFSGWKLYQHDPQRLVKTRCRTAKVVSFDSLRQAQQEKEEQEKAERKSRGKRDEEKRGAMRDADRTYRKSISHITGHVVAPGNAVMLRIYDKVAELAAIQDREKTKAEQGIWSEAGWESGDPVTRVEFQLRGMVLDELKLRDPARLCNALQPTWNALVGVGDAVKASDKRSGWIRLAGKKRPIDPRWKALRLLDWTGPATVAERVRCRNAVPLRAALGNVLSYLAGIGELPDLPDVDPYMLDSAPREKREEIIRLIMSRVSGRFTDAATAELLEDLNGATYAVCRPAEVRARFSEARADEPRKPRPVPRAINCRTGEQVATCMVEPPPKPEPPPEPEPRKSKQPARSRIRLF